MTTTNQRGHGQHRPEHDPNLDGTFCIHDDEEWPCEAVEAADRRHDQALADPHGGVTSDGRPATTDQPADLDRLRRAHAHYAQTGRDDDAHELAAELPALIGEVEQFRGEKETPMTDTNQPTALDLDTIQRRHQSIRDVAGRHTDDGTLAALAEWAHGIPAAGRPAVESAADVPVLVAEVERLRADNDRLRDQLGAAADKLLALGWDDVAAQMDAGTWNPHPHTNPA